MSGFLPGERESAFHRMKKAVEEIKFKADKVLTDSLGKLQLESRQQKMQRGDLFFECIPGCGHVPMDMVKAKQCGLDPWGKTLYSFTCPACDKFRVSILWRL